MWGNLHFQAKKNDFFSWFRLYVYKGRTFESLADQSGFSTKTLQRYVHYQLEKETPKLDLLISLPRPYYLVLDGLWFEKEFVLMVYCISGLPFIIHHSYMKKEWGSQITKDLEYLKELGCDPDGLVSDGGTGITKAIKKVFPFRPHQRCLVHVHRQASLGVGKRPKEKCLQRLKELINHLFLIESLEALTWWTEELLRWIRVNKDYLKENTHDAKRGRWWYTHPRVRRTIQILLNAPSQSFVFTKGHPLCPRSTNEVEGINAILSRRFTVHSGLSLIRWQSLLSWFIYFRNQHQLSKYLKN